MKTWLYIWPILLLLSCKKDNTTLDPLSELATLQGENGLSYAESLDQWTELKKQHGDSYIYQTRFISWTGFETTTELKIIDGVVVARIYQEFQRDEMTWEKTRTDSYTETVADLGSHPLGAPPLTIDELYDSCAAEYLTVDEKQNRIYFKTETNGLMTLCGFVPHYCADDCFMGISIDAFDWID